MNESISLPPKVTDNERFSPEFESMGSLAPMGWIVQKFGGTSLGHFASKIVKQVILPETSQWKVAVICSAISRSNKENGTTNRLLQACNELGTDGACFSQIIDHVELEHIQQAEKDICSIEIREGLIDRIRYECASVMKMLNAAYFLGDVSPACVGKVVSAGERLSCYHITAMLKDHGHEATCVDVSEMNLSAAVPINWTDKDFVDTVAAELSLRASSVPGIPVITGYFGIRPAGALVDFVGRGYTDLCAALVATGLNAERLEIWKEVDGVFTADPRHVSDAKLLYSLSTSELRNLTFYGSEVVHCTAVDVAMDRNLTMSVRNVKDPLKPGTLVTPNVEPSNEKQMIITKKDYMAIISVRSPPGMSGFELQNGVLDTLHKWHLTGGLVTISESGVSLAITIPEGSTYGAFHSAGLMLRCAIDELKAQFTVVKVSHSMAILCIVCRHAVSKDFALVCILQVLYDMGVPIKMVMQSAIDSVVGCVIEEKYAQLATMMLHQKLFSK